jgi:cellulose synthase/poly-beta-1,6-N-acetylglucosamine synthase-like glycosyltransferase
MTIFGWAVGLGLALWVFVAAQALVVAIYTAYMHPRARARREHAGSCAVVMALRGADDGLRDNLLAHLQQVAVDWHLHLIVDHPNDPAVAVIRQLPEGCRNRWTLHVLELDSATCSLKCLGLVQVVSRLLASDSPPDYFAFADSDGEVSRDWLWRLLEPLQDSGQAVSGRRPIGATTGHRWYSGLDDIRLVERVSELPTGGRPPAVWGGLIRYFWNLGSLPQMHLYQVVWGGSWAIHRKALQSSGLLRAWSDSLFEDTLVSKLVRDAGFGVVTAPGVLVRSYEPLEISAAVNWMTRQLLDMRLYHSSFPLTALHATLLAVLLVGTAGVGLAAWVQGEFAAAGWVLAAIGGYQLAYLLIWLSLQKTADRCLGQLQLGQPRQAVGGEFSDAGTRRSISQFLVRAPCYVIGMLLTQVCYPLATWQALWTRRIRWRGIDYEIRGPFQVKRLNYGPFPGGPSREPVEESR